MLEFSARTRSRYEDKDAAATFGFGSIILWIASTCAFDEGVVINESNVMAIIIAKNSGPLSSGGCRVTGTTSTWGVPYARQVVMLNGKSFCISFFMAASPHPTVLELHRRAVSVSIDRPCSCATIALVWSYPNHHFLPTLQQLRYAEFLPASTIARSLQLVLRELN